MFFRYIFPSLLWAAVILYLTLLPAAEMPEVPEWELISFHTAAHAGVFAVLAVLMLWGFKKQSRYFFVQQNAGLFTFFISFAFGAGIELLQSKLGWGRQGDVMDMVSDNIGTLLGIMSYFALYQKTALKNYL